MTFSTPTPVFNITEPWKSATRSPARSTLSDSDWQIQHNLMEASLCEVVSSPLSSIHFFIIRSTAVNSESGPFASMESDFSKKQVAPSFTS